MKNYHSCAERIETLKKNESNVSFAKRSGITEGAVRNLLKGSSPSLITLTKIAKAYSVRVAWLIGEDN